MADNIPSGGTPPATSAPAAAPAAASSSTSQQTDPIARVQAAKTPAELRGLVDELRRNPINTAKQPAPAAPAPKQEETPAETPAATEEAQPEETQAEATTEQAAEQTEPTEETTPVAEESESEETDGGDGPVTPLTGKRAHLRLPENDQVGRLAAALMKRNRDMSMVEAVARASEQLGIKPDASGKPKEEGKQDAPKKPLTIAEVDSLNKQKLAEYKKAMSELRFDDAADLQEQLLELTRSRFEIERNSEREHAAAEAKYHKEFSSNEAKAIELYPFAADPKSPGGKRMIEIEKTLEESGDPLFHSPLKPLKIAQMVAAELNIAPRSKNQPAKPAAAPAAPAPKKGIITSGSASTKPAATQQQPSIITEAQKASNVHELRKSLRKLGITSI